MNFHECISRLNSISDQYEVALFAFGLYQKDKEAEISHSLKKEEIRLSKFLETVKKKKAEKNETFNETEYRDAYKNLFCMHESWLSHPGQQAEQLKNSIRQNSLILTLSTFEIFLNDLLRHILTNKPDLLSPNRKIEIGKLIKLGTDTIILEEIERQIYSIDRKSIEERAKYFKTHLKIPWDKNFEHIKVIVEINNLRNNIVHQDTNLQISEEEFKKAADTCKKVVVKLMIKSSQQYRDIIAPLISQKKT